MRVLSSTVNESEKLKDYLKSRWGISTKGIIKLKQNKAILVNGKFRHMNYKLKKDDKVIVNFLYEKNTFEPKEIPIDVIYEDDWIIVVNKDPFVAVHPTRGIKTPTLLEGVAHYQEEKGEDYKIRIVNRIDRDTSGVVILAKCKYSHQRIFEQFIRGSISKKYLAIVTGKAEESFTVNGNIIRGEDGIRRILAETGKASLTEFKRLKFSEEYSLIECMPKTGRTHQIRVHLESVGHPIIGDNLYSNDTGSNRLMLHCSSMEINHPVSYERMLFKAGKKSDMNDFIKRYF